MVTKADTYRRSAVNPSGDNCMLELRIISMPNDRHNKAVEVVDLVNPSVPVINYTLKGVVNPRTAKYHAFQRLKEASFMLDEKESWKPVKDKLNKHTVVNGKKPKNPLMDMFEKLIENLETGAVIGFKLEATFADGVKQTVEKGAD